MIQTKTPWLNSLILGRRIKYSNIFLKTQWDETTEKGVCLVMVQSQDKLATNLHGMGLWCESNWDGVVYLLALKEAHAAIFWGPWVADMVYGLSFHVFLNIIYCCLIFIFFECCLMLCTEGQEEEWTPSPWWDRRGLSKDQKWINVSGKSLSSAHDKERARGKGEIHSDLQDSVTIVNKTILYSSDYTE